MEFAYYPGCSAESTTLEYDESVKESLKSLGVNLREILGWSCCGATSGHILNHELALALPARNIALAEKMGRDIVMPCAACFSRTKFAQYELGKDRSLKSRIEAIIGMPLNLSLKIKHVIEVLYHDVGINKIKGRVKKSLQGLKFVTYYGCYLVRPSKVMEFDDPENPRIMDEVMKAVGVEVIDWDYKVDCCGGGLSITLPEIAKGMINKITSSALEAGADAIITACPLCQTNLDIRQEASKTFRIPIIFFSELTALAFGSPRVKKWFKRHIVNPKSLLEKLNGYMT